jgi:eukaryotic-like serine/threonine-protein kinase
MPPSRDDDVGAAPTQAENPSDAKTQAGPIASRDSNPVILPAQAYDFGELIGRGGMGEVVSAHDRRIGRDVAVKRMRAANPTEDAVVRFLREARIQARLDHPAMVPVHELGVDADGRPYFTMKRLAGTTLAQRISERMNQTKLLRAFADVCLAIQFAHERGVVHRDLKPANIMMGDYHDVYVLDWGIARMTTDLIEDRISDTDGDYAQTQAGAVLGTPGYMAPEQIQGQVAGPSSDVYALGAVLFEILTGEPLHPPGAAALTRTLAAPQQSPVERAPDRDIAPELDAACLGALMEFPDDRPTARELGERVQNYLDGDRDVARRKELAEHELALARAAFASGDPEQRATAIRGAGRALALDATSQAAAELVATLMVEPSKELPKQLAAQLLEGDRAEVKRRARISMGAMISVLAVLVVVPWMQIRSWTTLGITLAVLVGSIPLIWFSSRRNQEGPVPVILITGIVTIAFTRVVGTFMLTPVITTGCLFAMSVNSWLQARPYLVYGWVVVVTAVPLALERIGVFQVTTNLSEGGLCATSPIFAGQGWPDAVALVVSNFVLLLGMAKYSLETNRSITVARHELGTQAWHLSQLLPSRDLRKIR